MRNSNVRLAYLVFYCDCYYQKANLESHIKKIG